MDTLTFQVYAPPEKKFNSNENADPVSVEYLYLELVDANNNVVGCTGGELEDNVAVNTYLKDKVQGNASIPDSTWSMLKIDLTKWDTARLQNVKYIRVGYDYARNIYFRNFTFSRSVVTTKAGFTTKQYDIPDYGTADKGGLAIPVGAQYTSNKGDGGKTYAIAKDGQFDLANGEIVSFKDQFRRGSYISLREDTAGSLFDTRWEIYENDRLVQGMGTGDTVKNDENGKAPKPLCKDNDVAPDDSRAEVYMTDSVDGVPQANKGYPTTQKPEGANTIVFRSYTNPDDTDQLTKLRVKFINTVKVGSLSITKSEPNGESYLADKGEPFSFTIVFNNIGGLGLGGNKPVVKQVQVEVGNTVTLKGIPVGTHFTITEDAHEGAFLKGAKLNGSAVNGSVVEGTIAADSTVTAEFTNTARELFDIKLDKQWQDADGHALAHDGLPDRVWVQLQRRVGNDGEWQAVEDYKTVELTHSRQADTWTATITALDKYADPTDKTKQYTYRVVEYSVNKDGSKTLDNGSGVLLGDYKYDPSYTYKSTEGGTLPDGITGGGSITITNKRQKPKYKLDITKQGIDGEKEPVLLNGVEFTLEKLDDKNVYRPVGEKQATGTDGKCSFTGLEPGSYRLTEVKTAEGYNLLAEPIEFALTENGECELGDGTPLGKVTGDTAKGYTIALTINNRKGLTLPHTGADAPSLWVLIGLPLLVAGLLVLVFRYNRKGGKRS